MLTNRCSIILAEVDLPFTQAILKNLKYFFNRLFVVVIIQLNDDGHFSCCASKIFLISNFLRHENTNFTQYGVHLLLFFLPAQAERLRSNDWRLQKK